jgi:hypothetical protein
MAKQPQTLDARIATALKLNGDADRDTLVALIQEAIEAIAFANVTIEAETPKLLDLSNETPDKSRELIESNKLKIERLTLAVPQLQSRVDTIDHETAVANWNGEYNALIETATALFDELGETYPELLIKLMDLRDRIVETHWAFHNLGQRAPKGVDTSFPRVEPYDGFWECMFMPSYVTPGKSYPPQPPSKKEQEEAAMRNFAIAAAEQAKAWSLKVVTESDREIINRREAEAALKEQDERAASLEAFYKAEREAERRRVYGE